MFNRYVALLSLALLLALGSVEQATACLTPTGPATASVEALGPNAGNLERLRVRVEGFDLAPLASYGVGCSVGLSLESQITGPPLWLIQKRTVSTGLTVVDPATGAESFDFALNTPLTADFHGEAMGLGYFTWPMPVAFAPFSTASGGSLPSGPVELVFDLLVKPGYTIQEVIDDLAANGSVASDYSIEAGGTTYLLWSSFPFLTQLASVSLP